MKLPRWAHTIQARLIIGYAVLLSVLLSVVGMCATASARVSLENFDLEIQNQRLIGARNLLQDIYDHQLDQTDPISALEELRHLSRLHVEPIFIVDGNGFVIVDSHNLASEDDGIAAMRPGWMERVEPSSFAPISLDQTRIGYIVFAYAALQELSTVEISTSAVDGGGSLDVHSDSTISSANGTLSIPNGALSQSANDQSDASTLANLRSFRDTAANRATSTDFDRYGLPTKQATAGLVDELTLTLILIGIMAVLIGLIMIVLYTRSAFRPLYELAEAAERLGKGELDQRIRTDHQGQIGRLATSFNTMASDLQTADHRRRRLTADISHELRTPLANIRGYVEAVQDGVVDPDDEVLNIVHKETLHLTALVDDLRLLAGVDAGVLNLDITPNRIDVLAREVVQAFEQRAGDSGIGLHCVVENQLPLVDIDLTRMAQTIENLLENALHYSNQCDDITVRLLQRSSDSNVLVSVEDHGDGIPPEHLDNIFGQFYRVDTSRNRGTGGVGLGLTIVKRLVEAHSGEIQVESEVGRGTTFTIALPPSQTTHFQIAPQPDIALPTNQNSVIGGT